MRDIACGDNKSVGNLVAWGYLEEKTQETEGVMLGVRNLSKFYQATAKGHLVFSSWHKKIWHWIKGDIRIIVISVLTALITSAIAIFLEKFLR
ncbi:MAG: hypothetical protein GXP44_01705 [bacterium]|nr:hypothetical protein [bacterium]